MGEKQKLETLTTNLQYCRKECGYTQADVAKFLGISQPAYNKYESGETSIDYKKLERLGDLYGISPYKILTAETKNLSTSLAFAFRKDGSISDLNSLAEFKKIVLNYILMCDELSKDC